MTTKKPKGIPQIIIVTANDSMEQLKQVLTAISVRPDPSLFFSRCLICNIPVVEISRADVAGQVPEEIFGSRSEISRMSSVQASILGRLPFQSNDPTPRIRRSCLKAVLD